MRPTKVIGFAAIGIDELGKNYDCSFMVSFPLNAGLTQDQVRSAVAYAVKQFHDYHPTGKIVQQHERTIIMR